jgi:hypothetical protein
MYELYIEEADNDLVKFSFYKKMFLTRFNLQRKKLKKDTCSRCDCFELEIKNCADNEQLSVKKRKNVHLEERKLDMKISNDQPEVETFCFDLKKNSSPFENSNKYCIL